MRSYSGNSGRTALSGIALALCASLCLTAGAAVASDNASFVSYEGVPAWMEPGDTATVTVKMKNTGTSAWGPVAGGAGPKTVYTLGAASGTNWGTSTV